MKKVIFQFSVSVDGYIEGPQREIDWHLVDDEFNSFAIKTLAATDIMIMGRKTYELMASAWPSMPDTDPIAHAMNTKAKLVFSKTLTTVSWQNSRLAAGSIADELAHLKQKLGDGFISVGGSELASSFLDQDLIDEIRIIVTPVLLGRGKSVFGEITRRHRLKLVSSRPFKSGNIVLTYTPLRM